MKTLHVSYLYAWILMSVLSLSLISCNEKKEEKEKKKPVSAEDSNAEEETTAEQDPQPSPTPLAEASPTPMAVGGCYGQIQTILGIFDPALDVDKLISDNIAKISSTLSGVLQDSTLAAIKILLSAQSCDQFIKTVEDTVKGAGK